MIYFSTLILLVINIYLSTSVPQLDLPAFNNRTIIKPDIYTNSYTGNFNNYREDDRNGEPFRDLGVVKIDGPPQERDYENRGMVSDTDYINRERDIPNRDQDYPNSNRNYANQNQEYMRNRDIYNRHDDYNNNNQRNYWSRDHNFRPVNNENNSYRDPNHKYDQRNREDDFSVHSGDNNRGSDRNRDRMNEAYNRNLQTINRYLHQVDLQSSQECTINVAAQWDFETNVNEITQLAALSAQQRYSDFQRGLWEHIKELDRDRIDDPMIRRQLRQMSIVGPAALSADQLDRYNRLINDMLAIYNSASVCAYNEPFRCGLRLQPDLKHIMATSRDWDELQYIWQEWRRRTGQNVRDLYEQLVELSDDAAKLNNFTDTAEYWTFPFESASFRLEVQDVWQEIRPLYDLLHAYVRRRLRELYGPDKISRNAPLPAHALGDMWGQSWSNILDVSIPYPGRKFLDVTPQMVEQGYTPATIFQLAEEFYVSLNMTPMPASFWEGSLLQQPLDRPVLCQPSAWDFCNGKDYRIKMCTQVTHKDLLTAHHEMAHVHYFMQYRHQPKIFRDGANPGFHEAIGEAIALSISTPKHLQTLGLVHRSVDDTPHEINYLFAMAMDKVTFLPFALTMDAWRWDVFQKTVTKDQYNCHWWRLREQFGGIKPPLLRSEIDFDPGAKYHVPANIPYIRYFVGTVLQFQIHRALCRAAGQYDPSDTAKPLHKCDIYRSKEAGKVLTNLMEKGASKPWAQALVEATGEDRLDGQALREYFRPLEQWLRSENLRTQEQVGWVYDGDYCKHSIETAGLQVFGGFYNSSPALELDNYILVLINFILLCYSMILFS